MTAHILIYDRDLKFQGASRSCLIACFLVCICASTPGILHLRSQGCHRPYSTTFSVSLSFFAITLLFSEYFTILFTHLRSKSLLRLRRNATRRNATRRNTTQRISSSNQLFLPSTSLLLQAWLYIYTYPNTIT